MKLSKLLLLTAGMFLGFSLFAQNTIKGVLVDETTGEPLGFATVSLTRSGQTKPTKYVLSNDKGAFTLESVRNASYTLSAELMGYVAHKVEVKMESKAIDLGTIKMKVDQEVLEAAEVTALGNPIVIKKDTVEYNMAAFNPTDTDNLIDVLKKMPGIEVADDGTITANGETIKKITIEGKTFFLNDPNMATQNLPAKVINKLKVIRKKSEQAEFTGIDDGEEETVIDLSVHPNMMQGLMGRATVGVGHDVPAAEGDLNDWRYVGNLFLGRFNQKTQLSLILNGSNTNGGRGGGRGNGGGGFGGGGGMGGEGGISTSYGAGVNAATEAFDGRMQVGGNYNYDHRSNESLSDRSSTNYLAAGYNQIEESHSQNLSGSNTHGFGLRLEHKFSDNASIIFEPQVNFGNSSSSSSSNNEKWRDDDGVLTALTRAKASNSSVGKNSSTSGYLLYRQRLGIPGRTLTANVRYSMNQNSSEGLNNNTTEFLTEDRTTVLNLRNVSGSNSYQTSARMTYTEPLGNYFYLEANYNFSWSKSKSNKTAYDLLNDGAVDYDNTNGTERVNRRHDIGGNILFQNEKFHMQAGFSAMPNYTYTKSDVYLDGVLNPQVYEDNRFNFSPQAMMTWNPNDRWNLRFNYRGTSSQPETSDLMPVPDYSNPLRVRFGNPTLTPYFSHNMNSNIRYSNREKFISANFGFNGGFTQNPISTLSINGSNGGSYTMPFNSPTIGNAGTNYYFNIPIGRSAFSISNQGRINWRQSFSYEGVDVDMSKYTEEGFYEFMDWFIERFNDPTYHKAHIVGITTNNVSMTEMLRLTYRGSSVNFNLSGNTNMSRTFYNRDGDAATNRELANTLTWRNSINADFTWTWNLAAMEFQADASYMWYSGYVTNPEPMTLVNATINKRLGAVTLSLSVTDLLAQSRALSVTESGAMRSETLSNTLGRYILLSFSYNFGTMGGRRGGARMGGNRGGGMGGGMMGGGGMGGPM